MGDLFDFWIGLKCAFSEHGLLELSPAAKPFMEHWLEQTTNSGTATANALRLLWTFDKHVPPREGCKTVYVYGNHDNYMGPLKGLPDRYQPQGLVAMHGHQADSFNDDHNCKFGYLLTQAAFAIPAVRTLEDPLSALIAGCSSGIGPRLTLTELGLEECVFNPIMSGRKPAMTFVMGHTHEAVLQEIVVHEYMPANPQVSPPPPHIAPPAAAVDHKVNVVVRFLQVHVGPSFPDLVPPTTSLLQVDTAVALPGSANLLATVRQGNPRRSAHDGPSKDLPLLRDRPVSLTGETIQLGKPEVALVVATNAGLKIVIYSDADCPGASVAVGAFSWGGTRTIECKGKWHSYKVTFELLWGEIVP